MTLPKYYVKVADCAVHDWAEDEFYHDNPLNSIDEAKEWITEHRIDIEDHKYERVTIYECADNILKPIFHYSIDYDGWKEPPTWTHE